MTNNKHCIGCNSAYCIYVYGTNSTLITHTISISQNILTFLTPTMYLQDKWSRQTDRQQIQLDQKKASAKLTTLLALQHNYLNVVDLSKCFWSLKPCMRLAFKKMTLKRVSIIIPIMFLILFFPLVHQLLVFSFIAVNSNNYKSNCINSQLVISRAKSFHKCGPEPRVTKKNPTFW